jgi:hypothetical protein
MEHRATMTTTAPKPMFAPEEFAMEPILLFAQQKMNATTKEFATYILEPAQTLSHPKEKSAMIHSFALTMTVVLLEIALEHKLYAMPQTFAMKLELAMKPLENAQIPKS